MLDDVNFIKIVFSTGALLRLLVLEMLVAGGSELPVLLCELAMESEAATVSDAMVVQLLLDDVPLVLGEDDGARMDLFVLSCSRGGGGDLWQLVDGVALQPPYELRVIGDPAVIEPALRIPGGAADDVATDHGALQSAPSDDVIIDAIAEPRPQEHATPVR